MSHQIRFVNLSNANQNSSVINSKKPEPYVHSSHIQNAFQAMNTMRQEKLFCDVILVIDNVEIPAHKMVLASSSQYFRAMFIGKFEETKLQRIILRDVDQEAVGLLIDYIYTGQIIILEENVEELLSAFHFFELTDVQDGCCEFLKKQLHPTTCLGIKSCADFYGCHKLSIDAAHYIEENFEEIVEGEEFMSLSNDDVTKVISSDDLQIPSEEVVYECVMSWVRFDLQNRRKYICGLMEFVRLPLLPANYIVEVVMQEPLLKDDCQIKDYILEALEYNISGNNSNSSRAKLRKYLSYGSNYPYIYR